MNKIKKLNDFNKKVISAFPGCGKSHFFRNSDLVVSDSDSSKFDKSDFPNNYIQHIKDKLNDNETEIIFISSHKEVREALRDNGIEFMLIYPNINLKESYINRYKERGSDDNFINFLSNNWDNFINEIKEEDYYTKVELSEGKYISDII